MKFKSSLFIGAVALAATSLVAISANAGEKLRWKMQSTWGSQVAINGEAAVYFSNKVKSISGGDVQLRFHEPNALVPLGLHTPKRMEDHIHDYMVCQSCVQ